MRYPKEAIENYRKDAGDLENEVIDEYRSGTMSRTELFKRGSVVGISLPMLGLLSGTPVAAAAPFLGGRASSGTLRIGHISVDGSLEPPLLQSLGALGVSMLAREQLVYADKNAVLRPMLATSWKSSNNAKTWTFQLRKGVKFHEGQPFSADDVLVK